jgi:hypothetical protein
MTWLILNTESCDKTDQIDMVSDVHVKVSHAKWTDVGRTNITQKYQIF